MFTKVFYFETISIQSYDGSDRNFCGTLATIVAGLISGCIHPKENQELAEEQQVQFGI